MIVHRAKKHTAIAPSSLTLTDSTFVANKAISGNGGKGGAGGDGGVGGGNGGAFSAVALGTELGTVLITFGFWRKARMEEGFLTNELGADIYGPYCRRVPMLVPHLPRGRDPA